MMRLAKFLYHLLVARLSAVFYGRPSRQLIVVGVTGTKGKSSTCRFIASVLEAGGYKVGMLSTVEFQIGDKREPNNKKMTMLGRGYIQKMLKKMVNAGCTYAVIETSSEGIMQNRHAGIDYDVCVFTNLGSEHSERHGGFDNLRRDKAKIFSGLSGSYRKSINGKDVKKVIVANGDDANAAYFLNNISEEKFAYGLNPGLFGGVKYFSASILDEDEMGIDIEVDQREKFRINIPGRFNSYNALAAIAVAKSQGIDSESISRGISSVKSIAGRMEFIDQGQPFKVVVDYAHEPLSLRELFSSLRRIVGENHKVIGIIGSDGGGRDVGKRPKMGEVAGELCDIVVITDVNCFDEDPKEIAEMLAAGARTAGKVTNVNLFIETDRKKAIEKAINMLEPGDVTAITAKGTEPFIAVAHGQRIPWDDRSVAREILAGKGYTN